MHSLKIGEKEVGPYEAIMFSSGEKNGDILPILYDNAIINLSDQITEFHLCYKKTTNLFGKELKYADLVNAKTGETFSFQVSNIFFLKVIDGDIKMIAKVGEELKFFENFGENEFEIESDGDKTELTPLGYFDTFVTYDDDYFYPLILDKNKKIKANIKSFYDYYGYKSYTDETGSHMIMLLENEDSSEENPIWYFVDNFRIISNKLDFRHSDDYVEKWDLDEDGDIVMEVTSHDIYHLIVPKDNSSRNTITFGKKVKTDKPRVKQTFTFSRIFEDTNFYNIVGKNDFGVFVFDRNKAVITEEEQKNIIYYKSFIKYVPTYKLFIMEDLNSELVILDEKGKYFLTTDLEKSNEIEEVFKSDNNKILEIKVKGESSFRKYVI